MVAETVFLTLPVNKQFLALFPKEQLVRGESHPTQPTRIPCGGSFVGMAMRCSLFIYPVLFLVGHSSAARDLSRRARLVERTRQRPIAERLSAVATNMRVPMVDDLGLGILAMKGELPTTAASPAFLRRFASAL